MARKTNRIWVLTVHNFPKKTEVFRFKTKREALKKGRNERMKGKSFKIEQFVFKLK